MNPQAVRCRLTRPMCRAPIDGARGRLPRPIAAAIRRCERIAQGLAGGDARHHDHAAKGDGLQNHRHALILAILRHDLGLGTKVA